MTSHSAGRFDPTQPPATIPAVPNTSGPASGTGALQAVPAAPGRLRAAWNATLATIGTIVGLAPHILHHIGLLAGTALVVGTGGTAVFGVVGFALSVPLLLRLRRRFGSWWAPAIGLAVFAAMFALSAFVIGPAISGRSGNTPGVDQPGPAVDHNSHH